MIKYLKLLEFFKEFLNGRDEWPSPVLVGLYVSDNYMSLAVAGDSYLKAHYYGLYPIGSLDDLVEQLQSLQSVDHKLRRIIVSSNNSVELDLDGKGIIGSNNNSVRADLSGITFPIRHPRPQCRRPGNFEVPSAVRMLQMINTYLKPLEFFKELLKEHDESPYPVLLCLYVSDNHVSLAESDEYYLAAHSRGLYPRGNLDDLVEELQSLQKLAGPNLRGIIVASNNSVRIDQSGITFPSRPPWCPKLCGLKESSAVRMLQRADLSGITFPIRHRLPQDPQLGNIEVSSVVHMLKVGLDFLNTLVDRKNVEGKKDSE
ncbi:hypothetical protein EZV62_002988 [Acer yangbiense]|uniref:Uncharacterized protein n=1 Tax=Acer yangbiense TaxID=1000413 RepID=A0A5C7IZ31_9ROSI|nr:hypothetical protein EZV62_002988 [Acer yangbiense]